LRRNLLLVNCLDTKGGAAGIAVSLLRGYREAGHEAWLAVSRKTLDDPRVLEMPQPPGRRAWRRTCQGLAERLDRARSLPGGRRLAAWVREVLPDPVDAARDRLGLETLDTPNSRDLLSRLPVAPDLIHCHNLHNRYFDLTRLPDWSRRRPVVLTLHDAWLLAGHCVHSLDCQRWRHGCGQCPNLGVYPPIRRDASARNWARKKHIFARSRLYVSTPSRWLLDKVEQSMLAPAAALSRVIPNGIDTAVFREGDRLAARQALGLPPEAAVFLFVAENPRENDWKDYATLKRAFLRLRGQTGRQPVLLALGGDAPDSELGGDVRLAPYQSDPALVARYYQAADVYAHAARAETFPTVILEAMACGAAVAATAVGGIPEQVVEGETGFLVPPGDDAALAARLKQLADDAEACAAMGRRAAGLAAARYSRRRMVADYLDWIEEIIADFQGPGRGRLSRPRA
jgi:glycosyltransferase involved in cell wall biosynthesis